MGAYISFAQKKFKSSSAYRFDNLMSVFFSILNVFIWMSIFRMLYGDQTDYEGITLKMVATNFALVYIVGNTFSMDDFFISNKVNDGSIANEFLRPVNLKVKDISRKYR